MDIVRKQSKIIRKGNIFYKIAWERTFAHSRSVDSTFKQAIELNP